VIEVELLKDVREMNEEQFVEVFNSLREKTKIFTDINEKLLKENPQLLFVLRVSLGLSQLELAKSIGVDKQWVRHFEAGRQGFKQSKALPKCVRVINKLMLGSFLNLYDILHRLKSYQLTRKKNFFKFPRHKLGIKRIFEMTREDFVNQFNLLKKKTNNFIKFDPEILIESPEFFAIFRVILDTSIPKFAKILGIDPSNIRRWESRRDRIMPEKAIELIKKIEGMFKNKKLLGNVDLDKTLLIFKKFTFFEAEEIKVMNLLKKYSVSFEIHSNMNGFRKKMNVDFVIPSANEPKVIIEVTKFSVKKRKDINNRIAIIDHRFQLLKLSNPAVKTIIVIKCQKKQRKLVERTISRETVNTDFSFVNNFNTLPSRIKESI